MKTAILGLGLIGEAWANNLKADGCLAAVWNRSPKSQWNSLFMKLPEVAAQASIIHIVVSDEKAATEVVQAISSFLNSGHLIIQSTTIDPKTSATLSNLVSRQQAQYLEAPFTGSLPAAEQRKTVFFLGGDEKAIEAASPYFKHLSQTQINLGSAQSACAVKLALNLHAAASVTAISEGLHICRKAGVSDEAFYSAFRQNTGFSALAALKEPKFRGRDYSPQFSVKHLAKDMRLLSTVPEHRKYPLLDQIRQILAQAEEQGLGDRDFTAVNQTLD